ncbi:NAD(P)-dependent oxidoreductase [Oribacterium sp. WCC10]|uniref:NAD(P)-dependent oxidoreductase n=1 Tax=Oribacterium sp. WCC10 TaxID=1855343 RepID=UPI0008E162D7|nr:NAD(P)-dependent oxidoreductase [Oribacterium sp. WCC10]SFG26276.1 Nucleoside-diphosphate-sugar epimerase [Oribacterium sp. WCC10]
MNRKRNRSDQPSCVLICGNTSFMDEEILQLIAEYYQVVLVGDKEVTEELSVCRSKKVSVYSENMISENFKRIMYSYSPDVVWYFSGHVDGNQGIQNESMMIEELIRDCGIYEVSKLIYISSVESLNYKLIKNEDSIGKKHYLSEESFVCAQSEKLVTFLSAQNNVKSVTVRIPHIFKKYNVNNWLGRLFGDVSQNKQPVKLPFNEKERVDFISLRNLTELLLDITEESMDYGGSYTALSGFRHTYKELGDILSKCESQTTIEYDEQQFFDLVLNEREEALRLKKEYGFVPVEDVFPEIIEAYYRYKDKAVKRKGYIEKLKELYEKVSNELFMVGELIIFFIIVQYLLKYTTNNVYFRFIDLRLFFVVVLGCAHGMFAGILAGVMQCLSLIHAYIETGVTGSMLFYNTDYWLPFAIYLMTGAITGYMVTSKNQKLKFEEEEVKTLEGKYQFLNDVYLSVINNKQEYKKQILGYQDSFGKIFEAVERLDSSMPADIFMNGVETLEDILTNHSIAIYTIDENQNYARLVACSREMSEKLSKSLNVRSFSRVYDVISGQETWKNTEFTDGLPMYAFGITENGKVRLMISVYDAEADQMSQYYINLFTILCNLIRISFIRALEYQTVIEDEKYYPETVVLRPEYFEKELESQRKMSDAGLASYVLLSLDTGDIKETGRKLEKQIRNTDMVGDDRQGKHYLLLTQINRTILGRIGERLSDNDIKYEILEGM